MLSRALAVAASVAIALALVAGYAERAVVQSDQFANRATAALQDPGVQTVIGEEITDVVVARQEDLTAARPIIASVAETITGSRAFTGLFHTAVRDLHRALFDHDQRTLTLTVGDVGTVLGAALEVVRPKLAARVEKAGQRVELIGHEIGAVTATVTEVADTVRFLSLLLLALAVAFAGGALLLSRDRRRTVVALGAGAAVAGVVLLVVLGVARTLALDQVSDPDQRAAAGAIWDAFLADLGTAAWILAGAGAVAAAAASSLIRPVSLGEPLAALGRALAAEPARPALRALRGAALAAAGVLLLLHRDAAVRLVVAAAGAYLLYGGVAALLRLVPAPAPGPRRPRHAPRALVPALLAVVLIGGSAAVFVGSGGVSTAAPAAGPCNGDEALCDRPLDDVALPATHNSMSVPLPGWYSAEQDGAIGDQLRFGIRGLLIDTHYADRLGNGRLRTVLDEAGLRDAARRDGLSEKTVDAALRIRERLGFAGSGKRGIYLCHSFCELGGTPLADALDDLHDFLVANPGEVVVVINQDAIAPEDFVAAVRKAGLEDLAYSGPTTGPWPTLREMIDSGRRVVFLAEERGGAAPWYHPAYDAITQETPYAFSAPSLLTDPAKLAASCRPNRGPADAPLLLVNHWVTTDPLPKPSDADEVNAYEPLLRRLEECRRIRGRLPNLVAVNFYAHGDLLRAVDALNAAAGG